MCYKLLVLGINLEKVTNNNNDESAAEMALEKYINKRENSTDFALFSDTFCSRGACFIFYGYTTVIFSPGIKAQRTSTSPTGVLKSTLELDHMLGYN